VGPQLRFVVQDATHARRQGLTADGQQPNLCLQHPPEHDRPQVFEPVTLSDPSRPASLPGPNTAEARNDSGTSPCGAGGIAAMKPGTGLALSWNSAVPTK
jgi:hypothetical protein